jgi:Family of unknown function (DUF5681)
MNEAHKPGPGRNPPPAEYHFLKGTTGNKKGRPKGSIDTKRLTRKVANKKHAVRIDGRIVRKTLLQLVIESMIREAATGKPSMVALVDQIRAKISPTQDKQEGGFLLVPAEVSIEEFLAEEEARNANAREPGTYVNHKVEEMCKAAKGIYSPLGEAVLALHRRWGG